MASVNSILDKVLGFVDKNSTIVIIIAAGLILYKKFGDLFGFLTKKKEVEEENQQAHVDVLVAQKQVVPAKTNDPKKEAERRKVIASNTRLASAKFDAACADEIRKHTVVFNTDTYPVRWGKLDAVAVSIAKYKGNLANIAAEYKKAYNDDMYSDVRAIMRDRYTKWLATATKQ